MISNSVLPDAKKNDLFKRIQAKRGETNSAWLKRVIKENKLSQSGILLIGGNSVADFRIRFAQSPLRHDLTPSYWSQVGIMVDEENFYSVPLHWADELSEMPHANGIQLCSVADYNDPVHFPNIAFVQFTNQTEDVLKYADQLKLQRSVIDLPSLVIAWLEYVWAVGQKGNPLDNGQGIPSAVFAEIAYGIGGIELTPGLASSSSCPEAIWQAAKWWSGFYEETSQIKSGSEMQSIVPTGCFALRQPAAAIYEKPFTSSKETSRKNPKEKSR